MFVLAGVLILIGVVAIAIGEGMGLSAFSKWSEADKDGIQAYDDGDMDRYVEAAWDQHRANVALYYAGVVFDIGFMIVIAGLVILSFGLAMNQFRPVGQSGYIGPPSPPQRQV